jgi:hypothetical protein
MWLFNSYYTFVLNVAVFDRICQEGRDNIWPMFRWHGADVPCKALLELNFFSFILFSGKFRCTVYSIKTDPPSLDRVRNEFKVVKGITAPRKLSIYSLYS